MEERTRDPDGLKNNTNNVNTERNQIKHVLSCSVLMADLFFLILGQFDKKIKSQNLD